jgi:chorismate lyase / 3-hydroxybenzoate synthase
MAGPRFESWLLNPERYRFICLEQIESAAGIEADSKALYQELLHQVRGSSHAYLLRIWNYFSDINHGAQDEERYRQFCLGRASAVDAAFNAPPPAATAIGHDLTANGLQLIALCANHDAIALENPRQTPAWQYPREYGPVSPGFSRGAILDADTDTPRLLASGTASIVGHVSQHQNDVEEQTRESLRNLLALLEQGNRHVRKQFTLDQCESMRIYLRDHTALSGVQQVLRESALNFDRISFLRGDVCRKELDVEIEACFLAG